MCAARNSPNVCAAAFNDDRRDRFEIAPRSRYTQKLIEILPGWRGY